MEATNAGAIEALFASVNPAACQAEDIAQKLSRAMHEVACAKTGTGAPSLRSTYDGLSSVFDRMSKQQRRVDFDAASVKDIRSLLFGPTIPIEAVRLIRAEAIVTIAKASSQLGNELAVDIRELMTREASTQIRDRLAGALKA